MTQLDYLQGRTHFNNEGAQFAWDSTSLKYAFECPRKYFYIMMCDWTESEYSVHLIFGGHYARALEGYHKLRAMDIDHDKALVSIVRRAMLESWVHNTKDGKPIPGTGHEQIFNSKTKTREGLIRSIVWYLETFRDNDLPTYIRGDGSAAVELSFKLEVDNGLVFCGHLDRVISYDEHSRFIQDQKSTGSTLNTHYFRQYDMDIQMSMYTFAGKAIFQLPIKGVMIDAAQVSDGYTMFMRAFSHRSDDTLNEWYSQTLSRVATIQAYSRRFLDTGDPNVFPMNFTACNNFGGCPFRGVCAARPAQREKIFRVEYNKREMWNPLIER